MPYKTSSEATRRDSQVVVDRLGVQTLDVPITDQVDAYFARFPDASQLRLANKCARERMTVLYDQSAAFGALVAGTSNKSELLLGYGTQFGDMASAVNPIGDLYKTQLHHLAAIWACPRRFSPNSRPAICGWGRPTKESSASAMPRSIACWCCWSTAAGVGRNSCRRVRGRVRRSRGDDDPPQPLQAAHAGHRQALATAPWTATSAMPAIGEPRTLSRRRRRARTPCSPGRQHTLGPRRSACRCRLEEVAGHWAFRESPDRSLHRPASP